jgi:hypothetical protein
MTLVDLVTVSAIVNSPILAGIAAAKAGAGWFTPAYVAVGLVAGIGIAYILRRHFYLLAVIESKLETPLVHKFLIGAGMPLILVALLVMLLVVAWGTEFVVETISSGR